MGIVYTPMYQAMFAVKEGEECLAGKKEAERPLKLFGEFIYQGDFAVLLGAQGAGKSLLGLQVAEAISRDRPIGNFDIDCGREKVMFLDFENKEDEFTSRYIASGNPYKFNKNFLRVTIDPNYHDYTGLRKQVLKELNKVLGRKPVLLVVNNLEFLKCFVAESYIIGLLKELQMFRKLTVLLLAGANQREGARLGLHQLGRHVRNMADSVLALGHSRLDPAVRYLKQLKTSRGLPVYTEKKVAEFRIAKRDNFTGLWFTGFGKESPHIVEPPAGLDAEIVQLKIAEPQLTYTQIADRLDSYKMKVKRVLEKYAAMIEEHPSPLTPGDQNVTPAQHFPSPGGEGRLPGIQPLLSPGVREESAEPLETVVTPVTPVTGVTPVTPPFENPDDDLIELHEDGTTGSDPPGKKKLSYSEELRRRLNQRKRR